MNSGITAPRKSLSIGAKRGKFSGWSETQRERVARQVDSIRHWQIIEGDYTIAPEIKATWFIDAPYEGGAGAHYKHGSSSINYTSLGEWCRSRQGQAIVCENEGASWLPFETFGACKTGFARTSHEVVWTNS